LRQNNEASSKTSPSRKSGVAEASAEKRVKAVYPP